MTCRDVRMLLPMLADLEEEKKQAIFSHAKTCEECARKLEIWQDACGKLSEMQNEEVPQEFLCGWRSALKEETKEVKGRKRFTAWTAAAAAVVLVVSGSAMLSGQGTIRENFSRGEYEMAQDTAMTSYSMRSMENSDAMMAKVSGSEPAAYGGEQEEMESVIVRSASISLLSARFDDTLREIENLYNQCGGWAQSSSVSGTAFSKEGNGRYASLTLRIPEAALDTFLEDVGQYAEVRSKYISQQDVSASYYDTQSRLQMYRSQHDRLLELMQEAESMEDILTIEARASELQYTIDSLEGNLRLWKSEAEHSSVSITLEEILPESAVEAGLGARMKAGLFASWQNLKDFGQNAAVFAVSALPWVIFMGAAAYLVSLPIKRWREKRSKNR